MPVGGAVYDVFGGAQLTPDADGKVTVDLRHRPAAVLAVLPSPITGVTVAAGPVLNVQASGTTQIDWSVAVVGGSSGSVGSGGSDANGSVPLPVRVRILDDSQDILWEQYTQAPVSGGFTVPVNARGKIRVEAVELISGQAGSADGGVTVGTGASVMDLFTGPVASGGGASVAALAPRMSAGSDWQPAAARLGAHLSAVMLTADGASTVFSAANWDRNLYALDLVTGAPRWQSRVGHQFSYVPRTLPQGVWPCI